jgi:hypothetical protein
MNNYLQTLDKTDKYAWWNALKHGGLLIAPSRLTEFFVVEPQPLPRFVEDRLRGEVNRLRTGDTEHLSQLLDIVLEDVLELRDYWEKGNAVDRSWAHSVITGEQVKPRRLWQHPKGGILPVFVADVAQIGIGRGRRSLSRVIEWLRRADQKIALLTNGHQWRLIHGGADYDAWCEWETQLWFEGGQLGLQVLALRSLLGKTALTPEKPNAPSPLISAIQASRQGQAELSQVLGERVRLAVELLIRETLIAGTIAVDDGEINNRDIYIAATRMIMRCVVILFAEARNLLPRDNPIYNQSYSLQGLREQLDRRSGGRVNDRLRNSYAAYARLLALFRLVYHGSSHHALPIPHYGGGLFAQGNPNSTDHIIQALAVFEQPQNFPSDAVVYRILELLCRSKVKVRQGRRSTWVEAPVDFSDLSSEYIGILYEGLLDFELRRSQPDHPMIFLNLGDQPVLPLTRLEAMNDKALSSLVEKLKQKSKPDTGEDEDAEDEETETETEDGDTDTEETEDTDIDTETESDDSDGIKQLRDRALNWAVRAVKAGKLVSKPRSKKADALSQYEQNVTQMANRLIARIILPGEWYLVRWGGTRKGSGTFYTRPQLAVPTVQRTLQPLVYTKVDHKVAPDQYQVQPPGVLLNLKVCDPACGSASFLLAALRYLTDALWESLFYHRWLVEDDRGLRVDIPENAQPPWFVECVENLPVTLEKAEDHCKPRLKRYVVERCLYGVDINPLAVELARLALWVETMDKYLPFSFLDHKVKCGNALVGCWFDQFQDYPIMAWEREAGDKTHKGVHFDKQVWTKRIKDLRNDVVREELKELLTGVQLSLFEDRLIQSPEQTHDEALAVVDRIHGAVLNPQQQAEDYDRSFRQKRAIKQLKWAFDCWCAVWFWPGNDLSSSPTPLQFVNPSPEVVIAVEQIAESYQFFHWELEFPDVFREKGAGFDSIVGNPPWEIQKPNSREFFSNIDPLYRTYGKQEALDYQQQYFQEDPKIEENWLAYCERLKALSNWCKYAAFAFGDCEEAGSKFSLSRKKAEAEQLKTQWRNQRQSRTGYSDPDHPFQYQGSADINTYKMFLELAHALLQKGGYLGLIVPSGVYTDKGTTALRKLFLNRCRWQWLFVFVNADGIFNIHRSFKFCPVIVEKGGQTDAISTRFMERDVSKWEKAEQYVLSYPREQVEKFSPYTSAILEIRTETDLNILEKIYQNGILLGDNSPKGWGIKYATEFHMTNDSKLFPPRPKWEEKGYFPDEYGHWLKGNWQPYNGDVSILNRPQGLILSVDGQTAIQLDDVEDVALPLYQGIMIGQFDFSRKGWVSGTGLRAVWENIYFSEKQIRSQFLIALDDYQNNPGAFKGLKIVFRDIARNTDERTFIGSLLPNLPCGNVLGVLGSDKSNFGFLISCMNSLVFDWNVRQRIGGTHLNLFVIEELPLLFPKRIEAVPQLSNILASLCFVSYKFSPEWINFKQTYIDEKLNRECWKQLWAITPYERMRLRCIVDAIVGELYGLNREDFGWILQDCDHPVEKVCDNSFARSLEPKGFWRVDKEKDPELRHTVLSQIAFADLKEQGLETFLNLNDGEGWMIPDTITLAEYGLGHDDRAQTPQPVASRLGDRYLPWQLTGTPEQSWEECSRHAENLRNLLKTGVEPEPEPQTPKIPTPNLLPSDPNYQPPTDIFGNPLDVDLFGNIIEEQPKRKKKP